MQVLNAQGDCGKRHLFEEHSKRLRDAAPAIGGYSSLRGLADDRLHSLNLNSSLKNQAMIELVYISRATKCFQVNDIGSVLQKSRTNNQQLGITGMLVYRRPFFLQVLEGNEEDVARLVERISADPRHTDVTTVLMQTIRRPSFADWSMGFCEAKPGQTPEIIAQYEGYSDFFGSDFEPRLFAANPSKAKRLLLSFRDECLRPQVLPAAT